MSRWGPWKKLGIAAFLVVAVFAGRGVDAQSACGPCGDGYCDGYPCETDDTCPYDCAVGNTCWSNSGCSYGEVCMDYQCQPGWTGGMCVDWSDCYMSGQDCSGGYCVPGGGGGGSYCEAWWDCPGWSYCVGHMCIDSPAF